MASRNERVFTLLKTQKKKKADMARALGISKSAVTQWEKKGVEPTYEQCMILSSFFDVSVEYLYHGDKKMGESQLSIASGNKKDIKMAIDKIKDQLISGTNLMYDGKPMDEELTGVVLAAIEMAERTAILAAGKFNPKRERSIK